MNNAAADLVNLAVDPTRLRCPVCTARLVMPTDEQCDPLADLAIVCPSGCGNPFPLSGTVLTSAAYITATGGSYEGRVKIYPHAGRAFKHAAVIASKNPGQRFEVVSYATGEVVGLVLVPVNPNV